MSAHAAIAPAAEIQVRRPPVGRMVIVAVAYLAIVIVRAIYPLVSPLNGVWAGDVSLFDRAVDALWAALWLAVLLVSMARQPDGRLWKLIFLVIVTQYLARSSGSRTRSSGASAGCSTSSGSRCGSSSS